MKTCKRCQARLDYVESVQHKCYTVSEWKRFAKFTDDVVDGQSMTMQEILLGQYDILLIGHKSRHDNRFVRVPLKEKMRSGLKSLPSKINQKNFEKGMRVFDQGMDDFGKSMDALTDELGGKGTRTRLWSEKKTNDTDILFGNKKHVQKRKTRKKKQAKTQDEQNLEKILGRKK